ncbi:MAG TPA: hypothetical protein PLU82_00010 [Oscillospiraceae bacterium]|nr:hypothetical protein [Oscillospiraceae bacterium]
MNLTDFRREKNSTEKAYTYQVKENGTQPYVGILTLIEPLKKDEIISYKTRIDVKDGAHIMNPYYAQIVSIHTDKLVIRVKAKRGLLKDVYKVIYADKLMTPKYEVERKPITAKEDGEFVVYVVEQKQPNLNYSYCLEWNFVVNT